MQDQPLFFVWKYTDVDRRFWQEHLEGFLPLRLIDAHTHIGSTRFQLVPVTEEMRRQYWVNEIGEPIEAPTAEQAMKTVLPGREFSLVTIGSPSLEYDIEGSNEYVRQESLRRSWPALVVMLPQWSAERINQELDKPGIVGVKPYYTLISFNPATRDEHLEASIFDFLPHHALEVLNARRSWVTLHVPKAGRLCHPDNIREVREIRRRYPDIKLVIAHLGRCFTLPHAQEALPHLADDLGLYFDNSAVLNPAVHRFALETLGPRRILWGTDNPVFYMRGRRTWEGKQYINHTSHDFCFNRGKHEPPEVEATYTLYMYEALRAIKQACTELGLSREDVEAIFFGNAAKLLGGVQI